MGIIQIPPVEREIVHLPPASISNKKSYCQTILRSFARGESMYDILAAHKELNTSDIIECLNFAAEVVGGQWPQKSSEDQ